MCLKELLYSIKETNVECKECNFMDLKEQIIKFLNEETEQYRCTESGDCRAISNDNKEDTEYLADELIKLFSLHIVSQR